MNYEKQIKRFLYMEDVSTPTFRLYFCIFWMFDVNKFPESMKISKVDLMDIAKIGRAGYTKSIKELVEKGFIKYKIDLNESVFWLIEL